MEENQGKPNKIVQFFEKIAETIVPQYKELKQLRAENERWREEDQERRALEAKKIARQDEINALHDKWDQEALEEREESPEVESAWGLSDRRKQEMINRDRRQAEENRRKKQGSSGIGSPF